MFIPTEIFTRVSSRLRLAHPLRATLLFERRLHMVAPAARSAASARIRYGSAGGPEKIDLD